MPDAPGRFSRSGADVPATVCDRAVGQAAANAILAALFHRARTGEGQAVEVPMFETMAQFVLGDHFGGRSFEPPLGEAGYARVLAKFRAPYTTLDGHICALIYNDKQWKGFLDFIGKPEMLQQKEYATQEARSQNYDRAYAFVAEQMKTRTTAEWLAAFERADIPVQRMNSLDDIVADPHLAAIGYLKSVEHPSEGRIKSLAVPSEWSESAPEYRRHTPRLGEHTREVLEEMNLSKEKIEALLASGAARQAPL